VEAAVAGWKVDLSNVRKAEALWIESVWRWRVGAWEMTPIDLFVLFEVCCVQVVVWWCSRLRGVSQFLKKGGNSNGDRKGIGGGLVVLSTIFPKGLK
jgi:hypothetical protein